MIHRSQRTVVSTPLYTVQTHDSNCPT